MTIYRCVAEWNLPNSNTGQNVMYAEVVGGSAADQDDLITDFADIFDTIFAPWLAQIVNEVILELVRIYVFDPLLGTSVPVGTGTIGTAGAITTVNALPSGVAVKVQQFVAGRARPYGPYLIGAPTQQVNQFGQMTPTIAAAALAMGAASTLNRVMTLTGLTYEPVVYSPKDKAMYSLVGANNEIGVVYDYQRRRKGGSGI